MLKTIFLKHTLNFGYGASKIFLKIIFVTNYYFFLFYYASIFLLTFMSIVRLNTVNSKNTYHKVVNIFISKKNDNFTKLSTFKFRAKLSFLGSCIFFTCHTDRATSMCKRSSKGVFSKS